MGSPSPKTDLGSIVVTGQYGSGVQHRWACDWCSDGMATVCVCRPGPSWEGCACGEGNAECEDCSGRGYTFDEACDCRTCAPKWAAIEELEAK